MGFQLAKEDIDSIIKCETGAIERVLRFVQLQIAAYLKNPPPIASSSATYHYKSGSKSTKHSHNHQHNQFNIEMYEEQLASKDRQIEELKETVEIMDLKIKKLE